MNNQERRRWWALGALALSVLVVGLDLTVLNLALPTLGTDLHASTSDLQWFVDSYSLVLAALLLPAGLLGDRFGRKKILVPALVLFGLASLACAYSHTSGELVAARAVLGVGAAVIMPLSLAVIPVLFTPAERQKAIAVVMAAVFIGYPLGPILGGWLLDTFWWGSVFLINVPVIVLALIAVVLLMPESRSEHRPRLDLVGVVVSSAGLVALVYGFIKAGQDGWSDATALATIVGRRRGADRVRCLGAPGVPAARRPAAGPAVAVQVGGLHLGHDPVHAGVVRAVRDPVRDAALLPRRPRARLARRRRAAAADDRRNGGRHDRGHPAAEPGQDRRRHARRPARGR